MYIPTHTHTNNKNYTMMEVVCIPLVISTCAAHVWTHSNGCGP